MGSRASHRLRGKGSNNDDDDSPADRALALWANLVAADPARALSFSVLMAGCGAALGPFLDSYHSAFGVLTYNAPIAATLWGSAAFPALTTAWWVPELFGLAGFLIGWLYVLLDAVGGTDAGATRPSPAKTLLGISVFTLQYWISGILFQGRVDRTTILNLMSVVASIGFLALDGSTAGLLTSAATALGGPVIEAGLLWATRQGHFPGGYHYNDLGETGFFPLWIVPVYFLGGPAVGNLARSLWHALPATAAASGERGAALDAREREPCTVCDATRRVPCPNCDGVGTYVAMGGRSVRCTSCNARGFVLCRACFDRYDEDPYDIEAIRARMDRMPD